MNLEPLKLSDLIRRYHLRPQKSLGQNFLADHNTLLKIVRDSGVDMDDEVLEIGAGIGSLTRVLATNAKKVVAVEIDRHLFPVLKAVTQPFPNIQLVQGDILKIPITDLVEQGGYKVVANIPYYISSALIRYLLESEVRPDRIVFTMQREVAERITNADQKMSLLSLSVQIFGKATITSHIPASCFIPEPNVDSSVLVIDLFPEPVLQQSDIDLLFKLAHAAFNQKRKMLRSSLKAILGRGADSVVDILEQAGISSQERPEALALEDWVRLTKVVREKAVL